MNIHWDILILRLAVAIRARIYVLHIPHREACFLFYVRIILRSSYTQPELTITWIRTWVLTLQLRAQSSTVILKMAQRVDEKQSFLSSSTADNDTKPD